MPCSVAVVTKATPNLAGQNSGRACVDFPGLPGGVDKRRSGCLANPYAIGKRPVQSLNQLADKGSLFAERPCWYASARQAFEHEWNLRKVAPG
jgi:hypothetical protein